MKFVSTHKNLRVVSGDVRLKFENGVYETKDKEEIAAIKATPGFAEGVISVEGAEKEETPKAPEAPKANAPKAPATPKAPEAPKTPEAPKADDENKDPAADGKGTVSPQA